MNPIEPLRLAESGVQGALILALVVVPAGIQTVDARLTVVLAVMFAVLTLVAYALHAVTFDYFRLTGSRARGVVERTDPGAASPAGDRRAAYNGRSFRYTQREE